MRPYYYLGGNRGLTRLISGELLYVDTMDRSISPWIIDMGYWEMMVDDILWTLVRPGDNFIDVGANLGYYTIKMGSRVGPTGRVYSFEPNPDMFSFLADSVRINGLSSRVQLFNAAAGAEAGDAWLSFDPQHPGGAVIRGEPVESPKHLQVPVVRLDDVLPPGAAIQLIKIDAEGFEPPVLQGMAETLARNPQAALVIEMAYSQWAAFGDPMALLSQAATGRDVYRIHGTGWLQPTSLTELPTILEQETACYLLLLPPSRAREIRTFLSADKSRVRRSRQLAWRYRILRRLLNSIRRRLLPATPA